MKNSFITSYRVIALISLSWVVAACVSNPSVPSPSSSSGSQTQSTSSSSGKQAGQSGQSPVSTSPSEPGQNTGMQETGTDKAEPGRQQGDEGKSDEEILAEALEVFDEGIKNEQQRGDGQLQTSEREMSGSGSLTDSEKTGKLNKKMDEKFAKFDDLMLSKRESIARENSDGGAGGFDNTDDFENGGGSAEEDPLQTAMIDNNSTPPPPSSTTSRTGDKQTDAKMIEPPPDIGDAQDDDIIARQLREAAMKEQDPVLREKLWDEYRKYKRDATQAGR